VNWFATGFAVGMIGGTVVGWFGGAYVYHCCVFGWGRMKEFYRAGEIDYEASHDQAAKDMTYLDEMRKGWKR